MVDGGAREQLLRQLDARRSELLELARRLVRIPSPNPPGDTGAIAAEIRHILESIDQVDVQLVTAQEPVVNVVARTTGRNAGKRLVFNGHLDTFPVDDLDQWTVDPYGGVVQDGRLYGRGVSDMKAGVACSMLAFSLLCGVRSSWDGELVLTLVGDEETQKGLGTPYVLESVPYASGDTMISGDAGSPRVIRFGEKGVVWIEIEAKGRAAHGAHVHLGISAIDTIVGAVNRLATLRDLEVETPSKIEQAIAKAREISESLSGAGESDVLGRVTVNFGMIDGGTAPNLVADRARVVADIRLPAGVIAADIEKHVADLLGPVQSLSFRTLVSLDPHWTEPDDEIVLLSMRNAREALSEDVVTNMRIGATDSHFYRARGIPSVVCGLTPHGLGAPDEFVTIDELNAIARIHTLTAFDFLTSDRKA